MGQLTSGGTNRPATMRDLESYDLMRQQQAQQSAPVLQSRLNSHEYLFVALFDGTGQDARDPAQLPTNIGELDHQLKKLKREPANRLAHRYVEGIGTQRNPINRMIDGAVAYTWDDRIEEMYHELARKTRDWRSHDALAQVRLIEVGYSRGAVLVPGLARLVHDYGIVHPDGIKFGRDAHGNLSVTSRRTLIAPGQVAQAVGLFDPVGTNMPRNYDARLPASVISGYSQIARDERRELFPHQTLLDPDWSDDGRFLSTPVPGGHSNVGGGNREAGLEVMAFNGMVDYLNGLTDRPLFEHREVPSDPSQYMIFQARGATAVYGLRMDSDGQRDLRNELANCKVVDLCHDADPVDMSLARQFQWHAVKPVVVDTPPLLPDAIVAEQSRSLPEAHVGSLATPDVEATRKLQQDLNTLGVPDMNGEPLVAHGEYDVPTRTAVARFQRGHGLQVTGEADEQTRSTVEAQAFMADLRRVAQPATPERDMSVHARALPSAWEPTPPPAACDPRHPDSPDHALYNELHRCIPDAGPRRLLQFTAACHENGITAENLREVHLNEDNMTMGMYGHGPLVTPAVVDFSTPAPMPEQTIAQIQQFDQQQAQMMEQIHAQNVQLSQRGPRL